MDWEGARNGNTAVRIFCCERILILFCMTYFGNIQILNLQQRQTILLCDAGRKMAKRDACDILQ
jgi:hypothetical protein